MRARRLPGRLDLIEGACRFQVFELGRARLSERDFAAHSRMLEGLAELRQARDAGRHDEAIEIACAIGILLAQGAHRRVGQRGPKARGAQIAQVRKASDDAFARLERRYWQSDELQERYPTASAYLVAVTGKSPRTVRRWAQRRQGTAPTRARE